LATKECWFKKVIEQPLNIYELWHGAKFEDYQAFWILGHNGNFELGI